jgi:hypothetical protein
MAIAAAMRHGDRPGAELDKALSIIGDQTFGRGSWIRTNDLQYPKQWKTLPEGDGRGHADSRGLVSH